MSDDKKRPDPDEKDNVIRFPVERVKSKRKLKKLAGKMNDNRKTTLFLSLLSVLVMSAFLLQNLGVNQDRFMASNDDVRDMNKEKELAQSLLDPDKRTPASYGRKPSSEDEFIREDMLGRYSFRRSDNGKKLSVDIVVEGKEVYFINLVKRYSGKLNPEPEDIDSFLISRREMLILGGYDRVEPYADPDEKNLDAISYNLILDDKVIGRIRFELDQSKKLHSIKVQDLR